MTYDAGGVQNLEGWRSVKKFGDPWAVVSDLGSPGISQKNWMEVIMAKNLPFSIGEIHISWKYPSSCMVFLVYWSYCNCFFFFPLNTPAFPQHRNFLQLSPGYLQVYVMLIFRLWRRPGDQAPGGRNGQGVFEIFPPKSSLKIKRLWSYGK